MKSISYPASGLLDDLPNPGRVCSPIRYVATASLMLALMPCLSRPKTLLCSTPFRFSSLDLPEEVDDSILVLPSLSSSDQHLVVLSLLVSRDSLT